MDSTQQFVPKIVIKPNTYPKWFTPINVYDYSKKDIQDLQHPSLQAAELKIAEESLTAHSTYNWWLCYIQPSQKYINI